MSNLYCNPKYPEYTHQYQAQKRSNNNSKKDEYKIEKL